jgi:hypothetical protein
MARPRCSEVELNDLRSMPVPAVLGVPAERQSKEG